jgi:hypothetical protein
VTPIPMVPMVCAFKGSVPQTTLQLVQTPTFMSATMNSLVNYKLVITIPTVRHSCAALMVHVKSALQLYMILTTNELQLIHAIFLTQRPGVVHQRPPVLEPLLDGVTLRIVLELHQLHLKLKTAPTSPRLVTMVDVRLPLAQLQTWAHVDLNQMEKALLAFATLQTVYVNNAKEATQTRMENPFTTTVLDCTIIACSTLILHSNLLMQILKLLIRFPISIASAQCAPLMRTCTKKWANPYLMVTQSAHLNCSVTTRKLGSVSPTSA